MIPDPIELMELRIAVLASSYEEGVCQGCGEQVGEDFLVCASPTGDGPAICFNCAGIGA